MSEETLADDSSHYEVSLTAGQAFVGFVLLLCSLAASFVFGLMIGKGQVNDRLVVKREPAVIEASSLPKGGANDSRIVELGVPQSDSQEAVAVEAEPPASEVVAEQAPLNAAATPAPVAEAAETPGEAVEVAAEEPAAAPSVPEERLEKKEPARIVVKEERKPQPPAARETAETKREVAKKPSVPQQPAYAQLLSTGEAKTAETLAAKLIDAGFTSAYVERSQGQSGMIYRVRVKFPSDVEARASADRLRSIARTEPWITRQ